MEGTFLIYKHRCEQHYTAEKCSEIFYKMAGKPTCIEVDPSAMDKSKAWEIKLDTLIVALPWYRCHYKETDGSNCSTPLKHRITIKPVNSPDNHDEEEVAL